jgi:hypothetical protein
MKWMKVIRKMKSRMIQEFQQFVECQLIEGINMKMHMIQFESIVNLIHMKLMNVIHIWKNMMIQEFQHFEEFQLIEVMKMKMQKSRFGPIVNLTQKRLTGLCGKHSKGSGPKSKPNQESRSWQTLH